MSPFPRPDYRSLTRYSPDKRPVELDLSDNTNLWGPHPAALERVRAAAPEDLCRYPELYADVLRDAVACRFGVDPECVTTGAGSDDVLDSTFRAVYAPGARMVYAAPTFSMVEPLARMNALEARAVPWPDALERPERLVEDRPDLVYVCRPNNPTGSAPEAAWVDELIELARDTGSLLVLDEAYADFAETSFLRRAASEPRLVVARTASKALGLAGLRCGYAVAAPQTALEIEKSRGPFKVSRLAAEAAAAALTDGGDWLERVIRTCREFRGRLAEELSRRGLAPLESHTNFLLFPAPSGDAVADALRLRDLGVALRPFGDVPDVGDGLRVTVGPWPLMERFLEALDALLSDVRKEGGP